MFQDSMKLLLAAKEQEDLTSYIQAANAAAESAEQKKELARVLIKLCRHQDAEQILSGILEEEPDNGAVEYDLGRIAIALGKIEEGHTRFASALKKGYVNWKSLMSAALTEKAMGNSGTAARLMKQSAEMDEENPIPNMLLYSEYMEHRHFEEALQTAQKISERFPEAYTGYHAQITAMLQMRDFSSAKKQLEDIRPHFEDAADFVYDYAITLCMMQEAQKAVEFLREKEHLLKKDSVIYLRLRAQLAAQLQEEEEAKQICTDLFENHHIPSAGISLAVLLLREEKYAEAERCLQKLIEAANGSQFYHSALFFHAFCLEQMRDKNAREAYLDAIRIYEEAYKNSSYNLYCISFAAACYARLGDDKNAERCRALVAQGKEKLGLNNQV